MTTLTQVVVNGQAATLATTRTVIDSFNVASAQLDHVSFEVTNNDGSQTANLRIEARRSSAGVADETEWMGLDGIAPGETRYATLDCQGLRGIIVTGYASGAGSLSIAYSRIDSRTA